MAIKSKTPGLPVVAAFLTLFTVSCAYIPSDSRTDGVVIERNKQTRPAWADAPTDQLLYTSSETRFHYAVLKARDLPIAVKQSQTAAIDASFSLWKPLFDQQIYEFDPLKQLKNQPKINRELNDIIYRLAHRSHSEIAQIEDIYFERVKIDNYNGELEHFSEYFDVHTLVHLAPIDHEQLTQQLASELQSSRTPEIKRAGKELSKMLAKKSGVKTTKSTGRKSAEDRKTPTRGSTPHK